MVSVVILDDHTLFLEGIAEVLHRSGELQVLGLFDQHEACTRFLKENKVDVLLLDIQLQEKSGLNICKQYKWQFPELKILMVTMFQEASLVKLALQNGADGYLLKSSGKEELFYALRMVQQGGFYVDEKVEKIPSSSRAAKFWPPNKLPELSRREKEVLSLILQEKTTTEIASQLFISQKTVESHRANLFVKFDVRNVAGLVKKTIEFGIDLGLD